MTPTPTCEPSEEEIEALAQALYQLESWRMDPTPNTDIDWDGTNAWKAQWRACARWILQRYELRAKGQRCRGDGTLLVAMGDGDRSYLCIGCPACTPKATGCSECGSPASGHNQGCAAVVWPKATPKGDEPLNFCPRCRRWRNVCECDGSHASDGVSEAVESIGNGAPSKVPDVPAAPVTPERMSLLEHHCSDADFETIGRLRDESYAAGYQAARDDAANGLGVQLVELGPRTTRALVAAEVSRQHAVGAGDSRHWAQRVRIDTDALLAELAKEEK